MTWQEKKRRFSGSGFHCVLCGVGLKFLLNLHLYHQIRSNSRTSNEDGTSFGFMDFPSLNESFDVNRAILVNPSNGVSSQLGIDGAVSDRNIINPAIILQGEVENNNVLEIQNGEIGANNYPKSNDVGYFGYGGNSKEGENKLTLYVQGDIRSRNTQGWRGLFPKPRIACSLPSKFTPPVEIKGKLKVDAQTEKLTTGMKNCENKVVGFFVGKRLSFEAVKVAVSKLWNFQKEVTVKLYNSTAFIFEFKCEEDRKLGLDTGSVYITGGLFPLRPWTPLFENSISMIKSVPIWVMILWGSTPYVG
ncbi:hypothetical protein MKX01_005869 [Papaver californicum]|nr:hypothetical protein MKX01_005869 [Papaver californicum]